MIEEITFEEFKKRILDPAFKKVIYSPVPSLKGKYYLNYDPSKGVSDHPFNRIKRKFYELLNDCLINLDGNRSDRHKLASCICGAIALSDGLGHFDGKQHCANENIAVEAGLEVLKFYMIEEYYIETRNLNKKSLYKHDFELILPPKSENTNDKHEYSSNLYHSLNESKKCYKKQGDKCLKYDILAYSIILKNTIKVDLRISLTIKIHRICFH